MLCLLLLVLPCCCFAQSPGRSDDSLRKAADTAHFPVPFQFVAVEKSALAANTLYDGAVAWMQAVKDSLPGIVIKENKKSKIITAVNVPATADISCTVVIMIKRGSYTIRLQNYQYHSINGKTLPVEKAAAVPEYKDACNVERLLIMHNYTTIFQSFRQYLTSYRP